MLSNSMRSGDASLDRNDEYFQEEAEEIVDREFVMKTFHSTPALVAKAPVNGQRMWKPYDGGDYDESRFEVVDGMWDHEHCSVCNFKIQDGHTYWANANNVKLLCDECYEFYIVA